MPRGQQQKHPTGTFGFITAATLFSSYQSNEEDDGGDDPVQVHILHKNIFNSLHNQSFQRFRTVRLQGFVQMISRRIQMEHTTTRQRLATRLHLNSRLGFYKSVEQCLQRTVIERLSNQSAKLNCFHSRYSR